MTEKRFECRRERLLKKTDKLFAYAVRMAAERKLDAPRIGKMVNDCRKLRAFRLFDKKRGLALFEGAHGNLCKLQRGINLDLRPVELAVAF